MATLEETLMQDAAGSPDTIYTMYAGGSFTGNLQDRADEDWVLVELQAGTTYKISVAGHGAGGARDTILKLFDSHGGLIDENDDVNLAEGMLNSALTFYPHETGSYYLGVSSYRGNPTQDNSGAYRLTVMEVPDITGTGLADTLTGTGEGERIAGLDGDDTLSGGAGSDLLEGGPGADTLNGGAGDDTLNGGPGNDNLTGGAGNDIFVFSPDDGNGEDVITDFTTADDMLNLSAFGIEDIADLDPFTTTRSNGIVIDLTSLDGGTILLEGITDLEDTARDDFNGVTDTATEEIVVIGGSTFIL